MKFGAGNGPGRSGCWVRIKETLMGSVGGLREMGIWALEGYLGVELVFDCSGAKIGVDLSTAGDSCCNWLLAAIACMFDITNLANYRYSYSRKALQSH